MAIHFKKGVYLLLTLIISAGISGSAQDNILEQPDILKDVEHCLSATYGWDFQEADIIQAKLEKSLPEHPAPDFLKALITYWKHFPLLPEDPETDAFKDAIEQTLAKSARLLDDDPDHMEGIFFDMHARAFRAMFWADNGKAGKVIPDLDNMYRQTMRGIEYKEEFSEFYFSSGLYNYYIEAYVEKHPIYKPIALLFADGDKEKGLRELQYAINQTTYIKTEALLFMSLLQLNYEQDLGKAAEYAAALYNLYPDNSYYVAHYAIILLHRGEFTLAEMLTGKLTGHPGSFEQMLGMIFTGFILENRDERHARAQKLYLEGIRASEPFGAVAGLYRAIAFAGLSRLEHADGNVSEARNYERKSRSASGYDFILDYPFSP